MSIRRIGVEVRISRRTMWVGSKVYPLRHVTRVEPLEIVPRRGRILTRYGREAASWLGIGLLGLVVLACAGKALPPAAVAAYELVVLAALAVVTVRMIRRITTGTLYVLNISNAGSQQEVVASWDRQQIYGLMNQVVAAIDDPDVSYAVHIDHIDATGDVVFGNRSGDTVNGDVHHHH